MVLKAFRCQRHGHDQEREMLMEICEELFYQGRYVWLRSIKQVRIRGMLDGSNRIEYQRLTDHKRARFFAEEGDLVPIYSNSMLAALPIVKGRRQTMILFVHPNYVNDYEWDTAPSNTLTPVEIQFLIGVELPQDLDTVVRFVCKARNLVDGRGTLTKEGKRILIEYV